MHANEPPTARVPHVPHLLHPATCGLMKHGCRKHDESSLGLHYAVLKTPMWSVTTACYGMPRLEATEAEAWHRGRVCKASESPDLQLTKILLEFMRHASRDHPILCYIARQTPRLAALVRNPGRCTLESRYCSPPKSV